MHEEVFSPHGEGGLYFLSSTELEAYNFLAFCRASERAYSASRDGGFVLDGKWLWVEILDAMRCDARYPR